MKTGVVIWLAALFAGIVVLFWRIDWIYNLPTPIPAHYRNVLPGQQLDIASSLKLNNGKPVFLHFFNPECPCSKFNIEHFMSIVKQYGKEVNFVVVPVSKKSRSAAEIQDLFHLSLPVLMDTTLAEKCGVYSTPQAVIIDGNQKLFYRGNCNKSRYCTNTKTDYAKIALDSLLIQHPLANFSQYAMQSYGCPLPKSKSLSHE